MDTYKKPVFYIGDKPIKKLNTTEHTNLIHTANYRFKPISNPNDNLNDDYNKTYKTNATNATNASNITNASNTTNAINEKQIIKAERTNDKNNENICYKLFKYFIYLFINIY